MKDTRTTVAKLLSFFAYITNAPMSSPNPYKSLCSNANKIETKKFKHAKIIEYRNPSKLLISSYTRGLGTYTLIYRMNFIIAQHLEDNTCLPFSPIIRCFFKITIKGVNASPSFRCIYCRIQVVFAFLYC